MIAMINFILGPFPCSVVAGRHGRVGSKGRAKHRVGQPMPACYRWVRYPPNFWAIGKATMGGAGETRTVDVCVVGAGPVGGTLACRLAAAGVATAVVDRGALPPMEHPAFDGRAYAIAAGSRLVLEAAGLWERLPD